MKQSDPGLRRNVVLWGLEVGGQWTMGRERGELSRQRQQHIQTPRAGWASPERIVFSALSLKQLGALGKTGICSDKVSKLPSCNVNSSL